MKKIYFLFLISIFIFGCAAVQEPVKLLWGSSIKALENNRDSATVKAYECSKDACFDKIIKAIKAEEKREIQGTEEVKGTKEIVQVAGYEIFIQERKKGLIVVMGVPKSETTTEVGIFLTQSIDKETKVEIVSLSSAAQKIVSDYIFKELDKSYSAIIEKSL